MGRLGTTADIGNAVALICSPEANWITGQLVEVDGGASWMDAHLPLELQGVPKPKKHRRHRSTVRGCQTLIWIVSDFSDS